MPKVINFGSLNIDKVYQMPHIVKPGETLAGTAFNTWCGGKGGNQSVALARAGVQVLHAGCIGKDGSMLTENLRRNGVNIEFVKEVDRPSGHAIIQVDANGENAIILFPGANHAVTPELIDRVIAVAETGDFLLLQNEISLNELIIEKAVAAGMVICLNFAPFDAAVAEKIPLHLIKLLIVNEHEGADLTRIDTPEAAIDSLLEKYPEMTVVVTLGSKGVICGCKSERYQASPPDIDQVVDTTCAGDTFTGYFLEAFISGRPIKTCLDIGNYAASIAVSRPGATASIPFRDEVDLFMKSDSVVQSEK